MHVSIDNVYVRVYDVKGARCDPNGDGGEATMLTQTAEYALRAAVWLAQQGQRCVASERLAQVTQIPRRYLHHVLQALVRAGLVESYPGPGGGYRLAKEPQEITVLDIVNAVSPVPRIRHCPIIGGGHGANLCPLHRAIDRAAALVEAEFGRVTLQQLIPPAKDQSPLCEKRSALSQH